MSYKVEVLPAARRDIKRLPAQVRELVARRIDALAGDPRPRDAEALQGDLRGFLRIREGDWRIVYRVDSGARVVTVWEIGNRRRVYGDLARRC